jgi:antitoxin PrlF
MSHLTITAKGQVTFKKDLLKHLGVRPGEKVDVELLPNGRVELKPAKPAGSIEGFVGLLKGKAKKRLSIEEMNEISAKGWAGAK